MVSTKALDCCFIIRITLASKPTAKSYNPVFNVFIGRVCIIESNSLSKRLGQISSSAFSLCFLIPLQIMVQLDSSFLEYLGISIRATFVRIPYFQKVYQL